MGMFDSIYIDITCPFCKTTSNIECQTKELDCILNAYHTGDDITDKHNYLDCIADCQSEECLMHEEKKRGYRSGFGRMFNVRIFIDNGKVSGNYKIFEKWEEKDE